MDLLEGLNPEQREVVLHDIGPLLVAAVAGAGKTKALVSRIAYLVKVRGINPDLILAVTFSKKGADEMNERLKRLLGRTDARVGTFHSLGLELIRAEIPELADWEIDSTGAKYRACVKDAIGYRYMNWDDGDPTKIIRFISRCKAEQIGENDPRTYEMAKSVAKMPHEIARYQDAYKLAEDLRQVKIQDDSYIKKPFLTFDDMVFEAVWLLQHDESVRRRWAAKYQYVLQDEAQDQNLGQLLFGELLAKDHKNYMLVGDPAQTIFSWRGAHPEKLLAFEQDWGARVIKMGRNYRCGLDIVAKANASLYNMDPTSRLEMDMICERGTGANISVTEFANLDEEGSSIAEEILMLIEDGYDYKDLAILFRTNAQSRAPEEAMLRNGIPYRVLGGTNFYERREIKGILAHLRLAAGRGSLSDVRYCINMPFRYLGKAFIEKLLRVGEEYCNEDQYITDFCGLIEAVIEQTSLGRKQTDAARGWAAMVQDFYEKVRNSEPPANIVNDFVARTRYLEWLRRAEGEETPEDSRVTNVKEFYRSCARFPTVPELLDYVKQTVQDSKRAGRHNGAEQNKVTLATIHKSKGMEWRGVFLIGAAENILPHSLCEDDGEERRLFYVAMTRAKDTLAISTVEQASLGTRIMHLEPSRFIEEVGLSVSRSS